MLHLCSKSSLPAAPGYQVIRVCPSCGRSSKEDHITAPVRDLQAARRLRRESVDCHRPRGGPKNSCSSGCRVFSVAISVGGPVPIFMATYPLAVVIKTRGRPGAGGLCVCPRWWPGARWAALPAAECCLAASNSRSANGARDLRKKGTCEQASVIASAGVFAVNPSTKPGVLR